MEELQLFRGDTVRIKGKRGKETVCIVLQDEAVDSLNVKMNKVRALPAPPTPHPVPVPAPVRFALAPLARSSAWRARGVAATVPS